MILYLVDSAVEYVLDSASELDVLQIQLGSKFRMQSAGKQFAINGQRSQHIGTWGHTVPKAIAGRGVA